MGNKNYQLNCLSWTSFSRISHVLLSNFLVLTSERIYECHPTGQHQQAGKGPYSNLIFLIHHWLLACVVSTHMGSSCIADIANPTGNCFSAKQWHAIVIVNSIISSKYCCLNFAYKNSHLQPLKLMDLYVSVCFKNSRSWNRD